MKTCENLGVLVVIGQMISLLPSVILINSWSSKLDNEQN